MKPASQLMANMTNQPPELRVGPVVVSLETAEVVNDLFRRLRGIFPAWRQAWPSTEALDAAKSEWIKEFAEQGIRTLEQIEFGLQNCRKLKKPFAPSVGEFIAMCRQAPEMLGLLTADKAFREACRNAHPSMAGIAVWSHDAVYHAACESGFHNLNTLAQDASWRLFERNYEIAMRAVIAGEPLRKMPLALPDRVRVRTQKVGQDALAALRLRRAGGAR